MLPAEAAFAAADTGGTERMSNVERVTVAGLAVANILHDFVVDEVCPGTGIDAS